MFFPSSSLKSAYDHLPPHHSNMVHVIYVHTPIVHFEANSSQARESDIGLKSHLNLLENTRFAVGEKMMFTKFVLMCILTVAVSGGFAPTNIPVKRYCSTALSDALRLTCGGRYNSMSDYRDETYYRYPETLVRSRLISELLPERVGLVHECCRRPCGYNELRKYCLPVD
ncbi:unnamed protein product [Hermetia illucens]|uniref:Insulin-like domain-containing protein n=1 Tax=Hermetia illucens TaxID=343691 RepID=A0A7R8UX69_HERIL|nr:unnamed protein product [Hermetia illucens]